MAIIAAIINQKGGVGKSTTALALGAGLLKKGNRVLFVDLDAQGNLSYSLGATGEGATVYDVLLGNSAAKEAAIQVEGGDLLQSDSALSGADMQMTATGKEFRLKETLDEIAESYDYIIVDTPPALGILTVNALTACDNAIIPAQADVYSLQGVGQLFATIQVVRQYTNPNLHIDGILLTRYNQRAVLSRDMAEMLEDIAKQFDTTVYDISIREGIAHKEAQASRQDIFSYAPKSNAAADYSAFVEEYLKRQK